MATLLNQPVLAENPCSHATGYNALSTVLWMVDLTVYPTE
ncbi:MAG: hypothetical protein ACJAZO_005085 [Myxococcota bacterium]|jgi:hypothetical protein